MTSSLQDERGLTANAFNRLLTWLDDGVDSRGEAYLEMRRRLVAYFDRRNRPSPDDLADETFNRIARTLEGDGAIDLRPPARYVYVTARFVLLEDTRRREHSTLSLDAPIGGPAGPRAADGPRPGLASRIAAPGGTGQPDPADAAHEQRLDCLDRCLGTLTPPQRDLIVDYYRDVKRDKIERRRAIAQRLGISTNALAIRACRIRDALETCVDDCCQER